MDEVMVRLTVCITEHTATGDRTVIERTVVATEHEKQLIAAGIARLLDFNVTWTK